MNNQIFQVSDKLMPHAMDNKIYLEVMKTERSNSNKINAKKQCNLGTHIPNRTRIEN